MSAHPFIMRNVVLSFFLVGLTIFFPVVVLAEPVTSPRGHFWLSFSFYFFIFLCLLPSAFAVYLIHGFMRGRFLSSDADRQKAATDLSSDDYDSHRN